MAVFLFFNRGRSKVSKKVSEFDRYEREKWRKKRRPKSAGKKDLKKREAAGRKRRRISGRAIYMTTTNMDVDFYMPCG